MSITLKNAYAGVPNTERGRNAVISVDEKTKSKLIYGCGNSVVMRDINDPLKVDVYVGHSSKVTAAKFSPSGYYVCSGDEQGNIRVWATDNVDNTLKLEIRPLSGVIRDIAWSPDNQRIVVVGEGKGVFGAVFFWDSGSTVGDISGHSKEVLSCDMKPTRPFRIATADETGSVNFYQGPPFKFSHSNKDHTRFVNCVRFSPDGSQFITVSSDKTAQLFDGKTGEKLGSLEAGHGMSIYSAAWSPDGKQIVTASGDKTCKIWDAETKACVATCKVGDGKAPAYMQVACTWPSESEIVSVNLNGDINFIDTSNVDAPSRVFHGHNNKIYTIAHDPNHNMVYSGGAEGYLIAWEIGVGPKTRITGGHTNAIVSLGLAGNRLVAASNDETVRFVNTETNQYEGDALKLEGTPCDIAVSRANPDLVLIATHKNIHVLDGDQIRFVKDVTFTPTSISISPDEKEVIVGGEDKKIHVFEFDGQSLNESTTIEGHRGRLTIVRYSPDGSMIAAGDTNREIIVWDREARTKKHTGLVYHTTYVTSIDWSADSKYIVSGSVDRSVIVWDLDNNRRQIAPGAHQQGVEAVLFTGEDTVISAGNDYFLREWSFTF